MITKSNNAAAVMLLERLGGEERITLQMRSLGLRQTELTSERAYTSPVDIALLLEMIATRRAVSATASEEMLQLLLGQQRNDLLESLPPDIRVAHKTGDLKNLRNVADIVYAHSGPYLFVVLVADASTGADARAAILELS